MNEQRVFSSVTAIALAIVMLVPVVTASQPLTETSATWHGPRTPDGQPAVEGVWDAEGVGIETRQNIEQGADPIHSSIQGQEVLPANVIVEPPSKRIPYQPWAAAQKEVHFANRYNPDRRLRDPVALCRLPGVPRVNYQGVIRILQVPEYVVLVLDAFHIARIIPLDERPRLAENVKLWMGDSRGHWEGATLTIDVTNQSGETWFDWAGNFHTDAIHVVERWTFLDTETARYEATIEDPKAYTRPWKMAMTFKRQPFEEPLEEACFEGMRSP